MQIIEQNLTPKNPQKKSEDGIVVTDDFIAVIDGSTSKTTRSHSLFRSNGRYAMQLIANYIRKMPANITCHQFCIGVSSHVRKHYRKRELKYLFDHPEERLTASAIVYSRLCREVWMIGDCHCIVGGQYYDNPKPYEDELATLRAQMINESQLPKESFLTNDVARAAIIPRMLEHMKGQNVTYTVIDGFPIPEDKVRVITLDFHPWEIVLASDGYPYLEPTLADSEERLAWQREHDPLNIGQFKATKGFITGNNSFDDRSYIRFNV